MPQAVRCRRGSVQRDPDLVAPVAADPHGLAAHERSRIGPAFAEILGPGEAEAVVADGPAALSPPFAERRRHAAVAAEAQPRRAGGRLDGHRAADQLVAQVESPVAVAADRRAGAEE